MEAFWYLWRVTAEDAYTPVSIGCLRTTPDQVEVVALDDEAVASELEALAAAPALAFTEERVLEEDGGPVFATYERVAKRGDATWPEALVRNLAANTGIRITPTANPY